MLREGEIETGKMGKQTATNTDAKDGMIAILF